MAKLRRSGSLYYIVENGRTVFTLLGEPLELHDTVELQVGGRWVAARYTPSEVEGVLVPGFTIFDWSLPAELQLDPDVELRWADRVVH